MAQIPKDLKYLTDSEPGIKRKRSGEGFRYFTPLGKEIKEKKVLERIKALVIPPAWDDVWICLIDNGYLQATGIDAKGRKQYIYHPDWVEVCQQNKFNKLTGFGEVLPTLRSKVSSDLASRISKNRILATVVWLLENTFIRVGNEEYARENKSFGLTTLRNRHVKIRGENIKFEFMGKSGVAHSVSVTHPTIAKIVKQCIELPGYQIFQYIDKDGTKHLVDSGEVNDYLKSITGENTTAKDFRTWGGTVLSATTLHQTGDYQTEIELKDNLGLAIKQVSGLLRNTPAVCKSYYIHPTVMKTYEEKILVPHFENHYQKGKKLNKLSKEEYALLTLLEKYN